jgi:hypothetical protein
MAKRERYLGNFILLIYRGYRYIKKRVVQDYRGGVR